MIHQQKTAIKSPFATSCEILTGGEDYFSLFKKLIRESKKVIHLQTYIFNHDRTGLEVQEELIKAANRGVQIYIVLDGVGSNHLPKSFILAFEKAGIKVKFFSKVHISIPFRMGRRLHHKLLVVDYQKALIGGMNIADRYRGSEQVLPWLDYAVYLEGLICKQVHNLALRILNKRNFKKIFTKQFWDRDKEDVIQGIKVLENDFYRGKLEIRKSYYEAIENCEHSLILVASYFLPNFKLLRLLEKAVKRGVDVKLVLPFKSDIIIYPMAVRYFYRRLAKCGVDIHEYDKSILHAKIAAADYEWCTIGSYNLNDLSDLLSLELNVEILDKDIAKKFHKSLDQLVKQDCVDTPETIFLHSPLYKVWYWKLHYKVMMWILKLTYWVTDKSKNYPIE